MEFEYLPKMPVRKQNSHKGTYGKILNIAGSANYPGAAYLSSVSALRMGCGLVCLAAEDRVTDSVSAQSPEIVFTPISNVLGVIDEYDVVSIGCGLGVDSHTKIFFTSLMEKLSKLDIPVVIDASGLDILAETDGLSLPGKLILTPHPGEAAKLLKKRTTEIVEKYKFYAGEITKKYNCVTVMKTHQTYICTPGCEMGYTNLTGNSALAKAGSGDVLCGMIAGLIAQGLPIYDAAISAVYLHGRAAECASEELGEYSVLASDLLRFIPVAIKSLD